MNLRRSRRVENRPLRERLRRACLNAGAGRAAVSRQVLHPSALAIAYGADSDLRRRLGRAGREDHARGYEIRSHVAQLVSLRREVAQQPAI